MGSCATKSCSDEPLKKYLDTTTRARNKALKNHTDYPLNAKILKKLTLDLLNRYTDHNFLQAYSKPLKNFIDNYDYTKFASFLMSFSYFSLNEKSSFDLQITEESKRYIEKRSLATLETRETLISNATPRPASKVLGRASPSSTMRLSASPKGFSVSMLNSRGGLADLIKHEMMQKDNFFFELTLFFGEMYYSQYEVHVKAFGEIVNRIHNREPPAIVILEEAERLRIKRVCEEAVEDLQQFQEFLYNLLKVFTMQASMRINNTESYVPTTRILNILSTSLLFGRNRCYDTIFSLIRYSTIEQEFRLKDSFWKFRGTRPENFGLSKAFSLENEPVPYQEVIESLDYLDIYTDPNDKLQLILTIRKQIRKSLDTYRIKESLGQVPLAVTGDHLLPLYTYCLAINGNEKLRAHQIFMENFVEKNRLILNEEGYCFSTFIGAIDSLTGIKSPRISLDNINMAI